MSDVVSGAKPDQNQDEIAGSSYHAFVCILKDYSRLEALLLSCVEHNLSGGTIIDSRGMGQVLCQDIPLFLHLRDHFPAADGDSYLFLCVVKEAQLELCFTLAEQTCQPLAQGVAFSIPVGRFRRFSSPQPFFSQAGGQEPHGGTPQSS